MTANTHTLTEAAFIELLTTGTWTETDRYCEGCLGETFEYEPEINDHYRVRVPYYATIHENRECSGVVISACGGMTWWEERDEDGNRICCDGESGSGNDTGYYHVSVKVLDADGKELSKNELEALIAEHWPLADTFDDLFEAMLPTNDD